MPAPKIGQNGQTFANRGTLDATVGGKIAALKRALREARDLKLLVDQYSNAELVALQYTDGTNGTADEIGYLKGALADAEALYTVFLGGNNPKPANYNFDSQMKYVAAVV